MVVFHRLGPEQLRAIAAAQLAELARPLAERGVRVVAGPAALERVVERAYDPRYGARPVRRFLERHVGTRLARLAVEGRLDRPCTVSVHPADDAAAAGRGGGGVEEAGLELRVEEDADADMEPAAQTAGQAA